MSFPAIIPLTANKRVPFDQTIALMAWNLTGATLKMEIRAQPGGQGAALVTLNTVAPPAQGLSIAWDAAYPDPDGVLPAGASLLRILIDETVLEGLSYNVDPAKPLPLWYDIHVTPLDTALSKFVYSSGEFFIDPGVTL